MSGYLIGAIVVLLILCAAGALVMFNGLVSLRNEIRRSWSNIDVLLKQRFDEIPRLVEVCKGYMKHEREVLELVIKARARVTEAHDISERTRFNRPCTAFYSMGLFLYNIKFLSRSRFSHDLELPAASFRQFLRNFLHDGRFAEFISIAMSMISTSPS